MREIIPQDKNPALREISRDVPLREIGGKHLRELIADMKKLLAKEEHGVAIAAVQVGEPLRLFIVSGRALDERGARGAGKKPAQKPRHPDEVYINPKLLKMSRGKKEKHEGCLSISGFWGMVLRAEKATIRAYDEHGKVFTHGAAGFLAHVFQHEMDHLEGILYTDKATKLYEESDDDHNGEE